MIKQTLFNNHAALIRSVNQQGKKVIITYHPELTALQLFFSLSHVTAVSDSTSKCKQILPFCLSQEL